MEKQDLGARSRSKIQTTKTAYLFQDCRFDGRSPAVESRVEKKRKWKNSSLATYCSTPFPRLVSA